MSDDLQSIRSDIGHIKSAIKQLHKKVDDTERVRTHNLFCVYETLFLDPNKSEDLDVYMQGCNRKPEPSKVKGIVGCSFETAKDFIEKFKWDRYR